MCVNTTRGQFVSSLYRLHGSKFRLSVLWVAANLLTIQ